MTLAKPPFNFTHFETSLMQRLLKTAADCHGCTHPNPVVAAAIYKGEDIISIGVHSQYGADHAEVDAIKKAGTNIKGASIMVTLEPCTHHGNTPPCVDAIIRAGIQEVIFATKDPFLKEDHQSAEHVLTSHGISVKVGLCRKAAVLLNESFMYRHTYKRPFVHLKAGMSLDGKIALASGESKYITGELSRIQVHQMRLQSQVIMIGRRTLEQDDPALTIRYNLTSQYHKPPILVVVGSHIDPARSYRIFESGYPVIWVTSSVQDHAFSKRCSERWVFEPTGYGHFDWTWFLDRCYERSWHSILIEGGAGLYSSALQQQIVSKCSFFIAPKLVGQADAVAVATLPPIVSLQDVMSLQDVSIMSYGQDVCVSGYCHNSVF